MNFKVIITSLCSLIVVSCLSAHKINSSIDRNLIIPGKTAEGYNLGDRVENNSDKVFTSNAGDIADILDLECFSDLKFDSIIYNKDSYVLFLNKGIITAIAGVKTERRITSDAVLLEKGLNNFVLNYGNRGLLTIIRNNHRVYVYKELGIAVFNDYNNTINMYLIFKN